MWDVKPLDEYQCPSRVADRGDVGNKGVATDAASSGANCHRDCEQAVERAISVFARVGRAGEDEPSFGSSPLPPLSGGGCCGGGCGCGH